MRRFLIATALVAATAAIAAAPAEAAGGRHVRTISARTAAMAGPGGCQGFNAALTQAVATQIRTGKHAEARRLMRMFRICGR